MKKHLRQNHILKAREINNASISQEMAAKPIFTTTDELPSDIDVEKEVIYFVFCVGHNLFNLACSKITQPVLYKGMVNLIEKYPSINQKNKINLPNYETQYFYEKNNDTNLLICLTDHEDCMFMNRFDPNNFIKAFNYIHSEIVKKINDVHLTVQEFNQNLTALPMAENELDPRCPQKDLCSFSRMFINQTAETKNGFDVIKKEYDKRKLLSSNGPYHYIICYSIGYCHETSLSDVFETLYEKQQRIMEFDPSTDDKLTTQDIIDIRNNSTGFVYIVVCNANYGCIHSHNNIISKKETLIEQNARNNLLQAYDEILSSGEVLNDNCDMVKKDIIELFSIFLLCLERKYGITGNINDCFKARIYPILSLRKHNCTLYVNRLLNQAQNTDLESTTEYVKESVDISSKPNSIYYIIPITLVLIFLIAILLGLFVFCRKRVVNEPYICLQIIR